ncbi:hypothetical protein BDZ91DRAFT_846724 [Kalaharituber pfeilii]|nr:hypothetical protein BDZ91DRAFT_846724 [Kalaharituber pfeilii]
MEGCMMPSCVSDLELLSTAFLHPTITIPTYMIPISLPLDRSMQRARQFLIFLPPGIEPWEILFSRSVSSDPEPFFDNLPARLEAQQSHVQNMYTCNYNQPLLFVNNLIPEYDPIATGHRIDDAVSHSVSALWSNYPQIINNPPGECLPDGNQNSIKEIFSGIMDQRDAGMHFDSQNVQSPPNAAAAASQQSELMFWMPPNIPHDFVPAPSLPEYDIRFAEPATLVAPPTPY